jgi:D-glycero-alpha-D-manno-heptose-7-phosphate kinase
LDVWPLSVLHEGAVTVNLAVSRRARARVAEVPSGFEVVSRDREFVRSFGHAREARRVPSAALAAEAALALGRPAGLRIEIESDVPFGSGLGGSSAILVCLVAALSRLAGQSREDAATVDLCRDIETRVLQAPAGTQDYESALRGGLNVLRFGPGGVRVESPGLPLDRIGASLVLFDSGAAHHSGLNNWQILRARIEGDPGVAQALEGVRDAASEMAEAVARGDLPGMGAAMARDWEWRRKLSPAVSTPALEEGQRRAREAGAWGAKACGSGGGGILAVLAPPDRCARVRESLSGIPGGSLFDAVPEAAGIREEI